MTWSDFAPALPELFLAIATLALLLIGAIRAKPASRFIYCGAMAALAIALPLVWQLPGEKIVLFNGLFVADPLAKFVKTLLLGGAALSLLSSRTYVWQEIQGRFEYPLLILLATLGTLLMASAGDMLLLYVGLELQSLSLYVLATIRRDHVRSSEAGLKYFILGALSSGALLYGVSLIYGFTGTTNFDQLAAGLRDNVDLISPPVVVGIVFVLAGLAFKSSAAPFHMWTPDVYAGAPTSVTGFFAAVPKVAAVALLTRVLAVPFAAAHGAPGGWGLILQAMALCSMAVGAFAALRQRDLKRLLAYSSIGHVGYIMVGLAAGGEGAIRAVLVYLAIYIVMTLGIFALILGLRRAGRNVETIDDLAGLGQQQPLFALAGAALMFSLAGVPPLAGFLGKFYVFMAAVNAGYIWLAIAGVLLSAVSAFYYLRIIKVMYFDPLVEGALTVADRGAAIVLGFSSLFLVLLFFMPARLVDAASTVAHGLI